MYHWGNAASVMATIPSSQDWVKLFKPATAGCGRAPGFLKLFYEKCVCVCMYVCIFVCLSAPT